ncbi:phosphoenolpyruvate carboxykinase [Amphiplicatus metriothermophilus]|uniref:Phosphoenolpyruvate carboxykinase (ATP) n=1 Tax=Amphiplicatus metriothermophilus TaxID=1519374 RepID=A0A239PJF2_9PROT|nr:phosphoenolpyruvate carboxykinase [Amphiplicatus metriothermophilus]MBB5517744.1 phosphoenolpyruvate carboxykinase (ATP) [Amphiplicatus metriothermophilus]SNT67922.1 phosphoenolpyruvate carboxykinase (ATP) [Amphiplicatus metriothermophilus]
MSVSIKAARAALSSFAEASPGHLRNLPTAALYEAAIARGEGRIAAAGPLVVETGEHTGRSAEDKFVVRRPETEQTVWWDNNQAMTPAAFGRLHDDMLAYAAGRELFMQELYGGADPAHRLKVRVLTEYAWHSLFIQHLLIRPDLSERGWDEADFTIVDLPGFDADPARHGCRSKTVIALDFERRLVLIGGTSYAGEIKKSVFTILNYLLPPKGVMPMHCSVNVGPAGDPAVFFGLSGTGKTTLSADPARTLIGDDEHGWGEDGLFNFEGGCYAKMIRLSPTAEPEIYATTQRFGTVLENVVMDPVTRALDLDDPSLAENSRGAYPIDFIANADPSGRTGHPKNIVMLTCDAFGVMPPIARLTPAQAMYMFLSGYTAKVAGTEKGLGKEPQATFSTCFGAPFMPRHPSVYGKMLGALIERRGAACWLVSTGWTGGPYGTGRRMPIAETRALLAAALDGALAGAPMREDPVFGFAVPTAAPGVDPVLLDPRATWADPAAYDAQAKTLARMFVENFRAFEPFVADAVRAAGPRL